MGDLIRRFACRIFLSDAAQDINELVGRLGRPAEMRRWQRTQRLIPPPHVIKQRAVVECAAQYSLDTLVETGTYLGTMIDATKHVFRRIYSIELDEALYRRARRRFARFGHISIHHGDSGEVLRRLLATIDKPCLFWLDAHHSGVLTARGTLDTPIVAEVSHIFQHRVAGHVILIDDAHAFVGSGGYPTLSEFRSLVYSVQPAWAFEVKDDIIRIHRASIAPS